MTDVSEASSPRIRLMFVTGAMLAAATTNLFADYVAFDHPGTWKAGWSWYVPQGEAYTIDGRVWIESTNGTQAATNVLVKTSEEELIASIPVEPGGLTPSSWECDWLPPPGTNWLRAFAYGHNGASEYRVMKFIVSRENTIPTVENEECSRVQGKSSPTRIYPDRWDNNHGQVLTVLLVDPPQYGTVTVEQPAFLYSVAEDFVGQDMFTYKVNDGYADSNIGTAVVTVVSNTLPTPNGVCMELDTNSPAVRIDPYVYDADNIPDWQQELLCILIDPPQHGSVVADTEPNGAGTGFSYTPDAGYTGRDVFTYAVFDGIGTSEVASCQMLVRPPDDPLGAQVIVLVNSNLFPMVSNEVTRLKSDLEAEGYTSKIRLWPAFGTTPLELWTYLNSEYNDTNEHLQGVILVGDFPKARTYAFDIQAMAYRSPHTDLVFWNMNFFQEKDPIRPNDLCIWVSRINAEDARYGTEETLIRRALDANHGYRSGASRLPFGATFYMAKTFWDDPLYNSGEYTNFLEVWPALEAGHTRFIPERDDLDIGPNSGADAFVLGGDVFAETSHGDKDQYLGIGYSDLFRLIAQQRVALIGSCVSGAFGGMANNTIFTRGGGCVLVVGGTVINYAGDFQIHYDDLQSAVFRRRLAGGDSWGGSCLYSYPFFGTTDRTVFYGDLSLKAMASGAPNAMPSIETFAADRTNVCPGEIVNFSVAVNDPDAGATNSPFTPHEFVVEWFMDGYDCGRQAPTYTTQVSHADYGTQTNWTTTSRLFATPCIRTVRVEVMDEWRARAWRELTVTVNTPPVASNDVAAVEAGHGIRIEVLANDFDPDAQPLTLIGVGISPAHGSAEQDGDTFVYTSTNSSWSGVDTFSYVVTDSLGGTAAATVSVTVAADTTRPRPVAAYTDGSSGCVYVVFSEPVEAGSGPSGAENPANYELNNRAGVTGAVLLGDTRTVGLAVTGLLEYVEYVLTVNHVRDRAGVANAVSPDSQVPFACAAPLVGDDFESGGVSGGFGWAGDWTLGPDTTITTDAAPVEGAYHLRLLKAGTANRCVDLSGITHALLTFQWKAKSLDNDSETATVEVYDGAWHSLLTVSDGEDDDAYHEARIDLSSFAMVSNFLIRAAIHGSGTKDYFYLDALRMLAAGVTESSDADGDGMVDNWEIIHFGATDVSHGTPSEDRDGDGSGDRCEYLAGTDPCDPASCLIISDVTLNGAGDVVLSWQSVAGNTYAIEAGSNLVEGFVSNVDSNIPATPPLNIYTSTVNGNGGCFYRINLEN